MKIRFAILVACLLSGCAAQSASTNSTDGDEVWLLPWGLGQSSGSSKENTRSAPTNSTVGDEVWVLPMGLGRSSKKNNAIRYFVRTDGQPIDSAQAQAALAQCQAEGARSAYPWESTNACMAHNGYVAQ